MTNAYDFFPHGDSRHYWYLIMHSQFFCFYTLNVHSHFLNQRGAHIGHNLALLSLPVMAAVAVRKKVVSIGHFSPSFYFQSLQFFLFARSNQEQLYVLIALKIREMS